LIAPPSREYWRRKKIRIGFQRSFCSAKIFVKSRSSKLNSRIRSAKYLSNGKGDRHAKQDAFGGGFGNQLVIRPDARCLPEFGR
jgi:hypothetical protein